MNKKQIARSQTYKQTKLGMTLNRNGPITPIKRPQLPNWLKRTWLYAVYKRCILNIRIQTN